jgi:hypothetical protein
MQDALDGSEDCHLDAPPLVSPLRVGDAATGEIGSRQDAIVELREHMNALLFILDSVRSRLDDEQKQRIREAEASLALARKELDQK